MLTCLSVDANLVVPRVEREIRLIPPIHQLMLENRPPEGWVREFVKAPVESDALSRGDFFLCFKDNLRSEEV